MKFTLTAAIMERVTPRKGAYVEAAMGLFGKKKIGFRPLGVRVIVRQDPEPDEEISETSKLITKLATVQERPATGEVIAIGPGKITDQGAQVPVDESITVGARVMFGKFSGNTVKIGDEELLMLEEPDIMGVFE